MTALPGKKWKDLRPRPSQALYLGTGKMDQEGRIIPSSVECPDQSLRIRRSGSQRIDARILGPADWLWRDFSPQLSCTEVRRSQASDTIAGSAFLSWIVSRCPTSSLVAKSADSLPYCCPRVRDKSYSDFFRPPRPYLTRSSAKPGGARLASFGVENSKAENHCLTPLVYIRSQLFTLSQSHFTLLFT